MRDPRQRIIEALAEMGLALPPASSAREETVARLEAWKRDELEPRWRALAREHHPDRGGDPDRMARVNDAHDVLAVLQVRERPPEPPPVVVHVQWVGSGVFGAATNTTATGWGWTRVVR